MFPTRQAIAALLGACVMSTAVPAFAADALPAPAGPVVLTVTGAIEMTNGGGAARFDMAMLRTLEARQVETTTIWNEGRNTYTGVSLDALLSALDAHGTTILATAINDYSVEIPVSDATPGGPIVAYAMNGAAMSRRDKGPLWVIYPFDDNPTYRSEVVYSRSIWQLDRMHIVEER